MHLLFSKTQKRNSILLNVQNNTITRNNGYATSKSQSAIIVNRGDPPSFFHAQNATKTRDLNKKFSMFVDVLTTSSCIYESEKVTGCRNPVFSLGNSTVGRG